MSILEIPFQQHKFVVYYENSSMHRNSEDTNIDIWYSRNTVKIDFEKDELIATFSQTVDELRTLETLRYCDYVFIGLIEHGKEEPTHFMHYPVKTINLQPIVGLDYAHNHRVMAKATFKIIDSPIRSTK